MRLWGRHGRHGSQALPSVAAASPGRSGWVGLDLIKSSSQCPLPTVPCTAGMPAPVHRLGRGTSGVLLCACSEAARSALSREFAEHGLERGLEHGLLKDRGRMRKVYRALVQGLVEQDEVGGVGWVCGQVEWVGGACG